MTDPEPGRPGPVPPAGCTIRRIIAADAQRLALLGERSFREAWSAFNDPADMDAYCAEHFPQRRIEADLGTPTVQCFLADCEGGLAGYLRTEAGVPPACVQARSAAEISRLYVLRRWHGAGVAQALMAAALDALSAAGHDAAWLAVWQQAGRAQAFYRKCGFETVGDTTFRLGRDLQADFVLQRPLTSGGPGGSPWR